MIVDGTYTFAAPPERLWDLLLDPEVMAHVMPGATRLERVNDGRYEGDVRVKVGFLSADFALTVRLADLRHPEHYTMHIDSRGRFGTTRGTADVSLARADGGTAMRYRADLEIMGALGGVGRRVLESISRMMTKQGLESLNKELRRRIARER